MKYVRYMLAGIFWCSVTLSAPQSALSASLYIDPPLSELGRGDTMTLAVRLDTDEAAGECVNAVDAVIEYSASVDPVDVSIGKSIFPVWVEAPKIDKNTRTITFAGGIPNGYCGRVPGDPRLTNVLAEIVFKSPGFVIGVSEAERAEAKISFTDLSSAYLNDGRGTKADLDTYGATIKLSETVGDLTTNDWKEAVESDTIPPEPFTIELVRGEREFGGKHYIVFNTTDKQTGVDQYQVIEEPISQLGAFQWGRADAPWITARSPYVLNDQSLNSTIRVRAYDKAGNEYIATYVPDESKRTMSNAQKMTYMVYAFILLVVAMVCFVIIRFAMKRRARKQQRKQETDTATDDEDQALVVDEELYDNTK